MGAPKGNNNAAKAKIWSAAILRALEKRSRKERKQVIDSIADALIDKCLDRDLPAIKEFGDRVEGKVPQAIEGTGEGGEIKIGLTVQYVGADNGKPAG